MTQQNPFDPPQTFSQQGGVPPTGYGPDTPGTAGAATPPPGYPVPGQPPVPPSLQPGPDPKKKSWFARHKILTVVGAIAAVAIIASIAGGGGDGADDTAAPAVSTAAATEAATTAEAEATTEAPGEAPAEAPAEEPVDNTPGIGVTAADGKFEFVVTNVETGLPSIGNDMFGTQAQGTFALVHVTVTNIGDKAQSFFGDNQTLVDTQGREHSADTTAAIYLENSESMYTEINPGNSVNAIVVFDIPADAVPATITLHDSMFSGGVTVSLIQS